MMTILSLQAAAYVNNTLNLIGFLKEYYYSD